MSDPIVQFMVWVSAVAVALAFLGQMRADRRSADAWAFMALVAMLVGLGVIAYNDVNGDPLDNCRQIGSTQMVHIDGGWQCVPPGQES